MCGIDQCSLKGGIKHICVVCAVCAVCAMPTRYGSMFSICHCASAVIGSRKPCCVTSAEPIWLKLSLLVLVWGALSRHILPVHSVSARLNNPSSSRVFCRFLSLPPPPAFRRCPNKRPYLNRRTSVRTPWPSGISIAAAGGVRAVRAYPLTRRKVSAPGMAPFHACTYDRATSVKLQ